MTKAEALKSAANQAAALQEVEDFRIWKDARVYVTPKGGIDGYRGQHTSAIWFDGEKNQWFFRIGKGMTPREFQQNFDAIAKALSAQRVY